MSSVPSPDPAPSPSHNAAATIPQTGTIVPRAGKIGWVRWSIGFLLFFAVLINYIDRSSMSVAEHDMRLEFGLTEGQIGIILGSFGWSYALMQIPMGMLLDKIGIKWVMRAATTLWAISCFLTAMISGMGLLLVARLILGLAEAPIFPGAMKVTSYWFPRSERGLATVIFDSGQRLSNVIGFPIVGAAVAVFGWRGAFITIGALSLIYTAVFFFRYRDPKEMNRRGKLSDAELDHILSGGAQHEDAPRPNPLANIGYILRQRKVWGMSLGLGCAGYVQWMLLTWLPGFLQSQMHMDVAKSGLFTAIPWLFAVIVQYLLPGFWLDRLIRNGKSSTTVRRVFIVSGMLLATTIVGTAFTQDLFWSLVWITLGTTGITIAFSVTNSLPALIAPEGAVGATGAVMNTVNNIIGTTAPIVTGFIVQLTGSFAWAFLVAGIMLVVGLFFYIVVLGRIEQIPTAAERAEAVGVKA
ncbi:MFS transporter [Microbacterium capsulatum]|uniref:MFS transporter n=1 Tax=Microbacterium capsulatum TaxID=3041921 RepID=A0ABU0XFG6_9MICO|nr:MFS transporter [Microbacterium sp. ASV81]MDQ4213863.1 MFS transporter [Microbacterium sp. ASV81]